MSSQSETEISPEALSRGGQAPQAETTNTPEQRSAGARRRLTSFIPGTRRFRRRIQKVISERAKKRLEVFVSLKTLDEKTKRRLTPYVRRYANQLAAVEVWQRMAAISFFITLIIIIGFIVNTVGDVTNIDPLNRVPTPSQTSLGYLSDLVVLVAGALWIVLAFGHIWLVSKSKYLQFPLVMWGWPITVLALYAGLYYALVFRSKYSAPGMTTFFAVAALRGGYVLPYIIAVVIVMLLIVTPFSYAFDRRRRVLYPEAIIVDGLTTILLTVEGKTKWWTDTKYKVVPLLENVAACVEQHLFYKLQIGDPYTNAKLKNMTEEAAFAFRELKQTILAPNASAREHFVERVRSSLILAAEGKFGNLERVKVEKVSRQRAVKARISELFRILLSGALPFLLFVAAERVGFHIEEPFKTYIAIGVFIWAALTLLTALDPLYDKKMALLEGLWGKISGQKGGGKEGG